MAKQSLEDKIAGMASLLPIIPQLGWCQCITAL
jgi:hypothetical protein